MTRSDSDFHYKPLTANHFLLGQPYAELQAVDTKTVLAAKRYKKLQEVLKIFWSKLVDELSTHMRQYNNWITETRGVKLGDIALLLDPKKRGLLPLVRVTKVERGLDAKIRRVTVFDRFTHFPRAITSLAVLVPADDTEDKDVNKPPSTNRAQVNEKLSGN
jgi:hypothetical protein